MGLKRASPYNGRSPSILPIIDASNGESSPMLPNNNGFGGGGTPNNSKASFVRHSRARRLSGASSRPKKGLWEKIPMDLFVAAFVWYVVGVGSICTTKMLLMKEYAVPPLVLTFQQLVLGSSMIRICLAVTGKLQPLPQEQHREPQQYSIYFDFVLMGLFNALDFLASNTCFAHSAASFVETIKASEPITTTAIALFFRIDKLRTPEAMSMVVLIGGVYFATVGNTEAATHGVAPSSGVSTELSLHESVKTAIIVMTANVCFALRAKSQKLFRAHDEGRAMNDANLLMRMQQIGAASLLVPFLLFEGPGVWERTLATSYETQKTYCVLALINAAAFFSYSLASCYVLTKLSVVQHAGLGCLRRMFAILFTSFAFGVPISPTGGLGIVLCFMGFCSFTYFRYNSPKPQQALPNFATSPRHAMRHGMTATGRMN